MMSEALLLAAGFSTRLRPLTQHIPKILLPFLHVRMLDMQLAFLKHAGIRSFGINTHHGHEHVIKALERFNDFKITPFVESPTILGSGGGLFNMKTFGNEENLLVMNSDILCNIDLEKAYAYHQKNQALVTMILVREDESKYGSVRMDASGKISKLRSHQTPTGISKSGVFSGLQIVRRKLFNQIVPSGEFDLIEKLYIPLMQQGAPLFAYIDDSFWLDIGELKTYIPSQFTFLKHFPFWARGLFKGFHRGPDESWVHESASVSSQAQLQGPLFVGPHCVLKKDSRVLPQSILCRNVNLNEGSSTLDTLVYPDHTVPINKLHAHEIVINDKLIARIPS